MNYRNLSPRNQLSLCTMLAVASLPVHADHLEELVVTASHDERKVDVTDAIEVSPDVTQLLKKAPGIDVNSNGPLTGLLQYRGMYGARINASLDGMQLASAGPNSMDPPLSYAVGGQLEALRLYRGIAPVSAAQESIGGLVEAISYRGEFATQSDPLLSGQVIGSAQSVNAGSHLNTALFAANASHRLKLAAMTEQGDDAEFADGDIVPTEYTRQRYDIGYGFRSGSHTVQLDYAHNDTGDSGTPALPMDIESIEGDIYRIRYDYNSDAALRFDATLFGSELDHTMTNFHLREAPAASRWRRNVADSSNVGFEWNAQRTDDEGVWRFGIDGFHEEHASDIENPNAAAFFVTNFNAAEREVLGAYVERVQQIQEGVRAEVGLRYNHVAMDADEVDATPARMMPPAQALRDAFNDADRQQDDNNFDITAKTWFRLSPSNNAYVGIARKTRSPSYQERYLWLPLEATGGLADGLLYTGNIDLDPEVSRIVEFGIDYSSNGVTLSPRLFYNNVRDYIQGTPSEVAPAVMFVRMMNNANGTSNPDPLQFNNVDAQLYGFDMDWAWQLSSHWSLSGLLNYVRGKRDDNSEDNLYRIAPANATLRVHYRSRSWNAELEGIVYAKQDNVSTANAEQESSDYGVLNLLLNWQATAQLQLSAGVDNLLDRNYQPHLTGYNRAANPDIALHERLPANGINAFVRAAYSF